MNALHHLSLGVGALGVGVIMTGVARGLGCFVYAEMVALRGGDPRGLRGQLRHLLGHDLLPGLEFLIAADILGTLMRPELGNSPRSAPSSPSAP
ncbi:MAG: DUF1622 domain-containing protein [Limisphaerales bacterium]